MPEGGCFCGAIRYQIDDCEHLVANCHCSMCRRTSGAPFVTWVVVPREAFRYTSGEARQLASSARGSREFCPRCGTPLTFVTEERPEKIDITTGSLDDPHAFPPRVAVQEDAKLSWLSATEPSQT